MTVFRCSACAPRAAAEARTRFASWDEADRDALCAQLDLHGHGRLAGRIRGLSMRTATKAANQLVDAILARRLCLLAPAPTAPARR